MKRNVITLIFLVFSLLIIICLFDEKYKLQSILGDSRLSIGLDSKQYEITRGKVLPSSRNDVKILRIAAFYYWNKEDPLFMSPDFDYKEFNKAVLVLDKYQNQLLKFLGKEKHVYPADFLKVIGLVAKAHEDFINNPSDKSAKLLINRQELLVKTYKEEVVSLISEVSVSKKENPVFINTITSTNIILQDLNLLLKNADLLQVEIDKRKSCLDGTGECIRPALSFNKPVDLVGSDDSIPPVFLDKNLIFKVIGRKIDGPYAVNTPCFGWNSDFSYPKQYFYVNYVEKDNLSSVNIQQATDLYFDSISPDTQIPYQQKLLNQGIPYVFSASTAPYKCANLGYLAEVLTVGKFHADKKPILEILKSNSLQKEVKLENDFFAQKYPSYSNLSNISLIYGYLYRDMVIKKENSFIKEELLNRKLEAERKLSNLNLLLSYVSQYVKERLEFEEDVANKNPDFSKNYVIPKFISTDLYPFRSYYGMMYITFSSSFWRLNENPQYLEKRIVENALGFNSRYLNYKNAIKIFSVDEINSWRIPRITLYD